MIFFFFIYETDRSGPSANFAFFFFIDFEINLNIFGEIYLSICQSEFLERFEKGNIDFVFFFRHLKNSFGSCGHSSCIHTQTLYLYLIFLGHNMKLDSFVIRYSTTRKKTTWFFLSVLVPELRCHSFVQLLRPFSDPMWICISFSFIFQFHRNHRGNMTENIRTSYNQIYTTMEKKNCVL